MNFQMLREKLKQEFNTDNLYEMSRLCKALALESNSQAPFFIMQKVFSDIADYWDENPVIVEEAKLVQDELAKSLRELIDAIENSATTEQVMNLTNKVVTSYLFLFR